MLKDKAYKILKDRIIRGEYSPGEILTENSLSSELNMSRTPIRDASRLLEQENIVELLPKKGLLVKKTSVKEMREVYELREAVETYIVSYLIELDLLSADLLGELETLIKKQEEIIEDNGLDAFMDYDAKFHYKIVEYYGNDKFIQTMSQFYEQMVLAGTKALQSPGRIKTSLVEHKLILEALKNSDKEKAVAAIKTHLENGRNHML